MSGGSNSGPDARTFLLVGTSWIIRVGVFQCTLLICNSIWLAIFKGEFRELHQRFARCRRLYPGLLLVIRKSEHKPAGLSGRPRASIYYPGLLLVKSALDCLSESSLNGTTRASVVADELRLMRYSQSLSSKGGRSSRRP